MNKGKKMRKRNILWFLSMILLMIGLGGCDSAKPVVDINPTLQESEVPSAEPSLLEQLEKKAEKGDGDALATLGYLYYTGENVDADLTRAVDYLEQAVNAGAGNSGEIMTLLGNLYLNGTLPVDEAKAFSWYKRGAEAGNATAKQMLGRCYRQGIGVGADLEQAVKWYEEAVADEDALAMQELSYLYLTGEGVEQNTEEALSLLSDAAYGGDVTAMVAMAKFYYVGEYLEKDFSKAAMWYERAANQGNPEAMYWIGCMYYNAEGVEGSYTLAAKWLRSALEAGYEDASVWVRTLEAAGF